MMKAILAAAALAVTGAQADAAIYRLDFTPDWLIAGTDGPVSIFLDVPSLSNLRIRAGNQFGDFPLPVVGVGMLGEFWVMDTARAGFFLSTDAVGNLLDVRFFWGFDDSGADYWLTGYSYSDWPGFEPDTYSYEEAGGAWSVAMLDATHPVPLPASAPMLLTGAALLFGLRRRVTS